jgi:hypothetical protein
MYINTSCTPRRKNEMGKDIALVAERGVGVGKTTSKKIYHSQGEVPSTLLPSLQVVLRTNNPL